MSYLIHEIDSKLCNVAIKRDWAKLQDWPPKRTLDKRFPFQALKVGEGFKLKKSENTPNVFAVCTELKARYNRTYKVWFEKIKHPWGWEIVRLA